MTQQRGGGSAGARHVCVGFWPTFRCMISTVETLFCPYSSAYRRAVGLFASGLFKKYHRSPVCRQAHDTIPICSPVFSQKVSTGVLTLGLASNTTAGRSARELRSRLALLSRQWIIYVQIVQEIGPTVGAYSPLKGQVDSSQDALP